MITRKRLLWAGIPAAAAVAVFVLVFFQPQKLFLDDRVYEPAPAATVPPADSATGSLEGVTTDPAVPGQTNGGGGTARLVDPGSTIPAEPEGPKESARGAFRSLEHTTSGQAIVTEFPDGRRVLRFEDFATSNGPDLRVYLSAGSSDAGFGKEYGEDFVELGRLKGNLGSQNYEIPAGTDLSNYRNAVVWCARFSVGFGVATLVS
jgi:hypothetical protein